MAAREVLNWASEEGGLTSASSVSLERPLWSEGRTFETVTSLERLRDIVDGAIRSGICAVDTETQGLDLRVYPDKDGRMVPNHKLVGFSLCCDPLAAYYIPLRHKCGKNFEDLNQAVQQLNRLINSCTTWWFNGKFDHEVLFLEGVDNTPFLNSMAKGKVIWEDIGLAYDLCWSNLKNHSLKQAAVHLLDPMSSARHVQDMLDSAGVSKDELLAERLILWAKSQLQHITNPPSRAGLLEAFPVISRKFKKQPLERLWASLTFKMAELEDLFSEENRKRLKGALDFSELSPDANAAFYAGSDAMCTLLCGKVIFQECAYATKVLGASSQFTYKLEKSFIPVLRQEERHRILIDRHALIRYRELGYGDLESQIEEIQADVLAALQLRGSASKDTAEVTAVIKTMSASDFTHKYLNSPEAMSGLLFTHIGIPSEGMKKTESKQYASTKADEMEKLAARQGDRYPFITKINRYRSFAKYISTYLDPLTDGGEGGTGGCGVDARDNEARFGIRAIGAPTGRMSSGGSSERPDQGYTGTNVLAIPSGKKDATLPEWVLGIRTGFVPRPGYVWVSIDYSGQELRIATNLSGEDKWVAEFTTGSGDLHTVSARDVYDIPPGGEVQKWQRSKAKAFNFASLYGGGVQAYMRTIGGDKMSMPEAQRRLKEYYLKNPKTKAFIDGQFVKAKAHGGIFTAFSRWCPIPDASLDIDQALLEADTNDRAEISKSYRWRISSSKREAINYCIQGSGADITKMAAVSVWNNARKLGWITDGVDWRSDKLKFLLPVHDELNFEVHESILAEACPLLEKWMLGFQVLKPNWPVKFAVEVTLGPNWKKQLLWKRVVSGDLPKEGDDDYKDLALYMTYRRMYLERVGDSVPTVQRVLAVSVPEAVITQPSVEIAPIAPIAPAVCELMPAVSEPVAVHVIEESKCSEDSEDSAPVSYTETDLDDLLSSAESSDLEPEPVEAPKRTAPARLALLAPSSTAPPLTQAAVQAQAVLAASGQSSHEPVLVTEAPEGAATYRATDKFIIDHAMSVFLRPLAEGVRKGLDGTLFFTYTLDRCSMTEWCARRVASIVASCPGGFVLNLIGTDGNKVILSKKPIMVEPIRFMFLMREYNL